LFLLCFFLLQPNTSLLAVDDKTGALKHAAELNAFALKNTADGCPCSPVL
jgi:hypothetical protein